MSEEVLTTKQAADYLKVSKPTLYRLLHDGKIRAVNIGQKDRPRWIIHRSALEAFARGDDLARR